MHDEEDQHDEDDDDEEEDDAEEEDDDEVRGSCTSIMHGLLQF